MLTPVGGFFFGYDIGWISGVLGMEYYVSMITGLAPPPATPSELFQIAAPEKSLITSILSAGTCIGALIAGDCADYFGRRTTILGGCILFAVGVVLEVASTGVNLMVAGRCIAGLGVGFESAVVILYMSEVAPRKVRGAMIAGYQFMITIGLLVASCITYATEGRNDSGSYRIPIAIQFVPALVLFVGLLILPESPRWHVKKGNLEKARQCLARVRDQPMDSKYIDDELAEIVANHEYESAMCPDRGYFNSWAACFKGSIWKPSSNLRRTILGASLQMMQQWTGVNFIFYFGTTFFQQLGTISNPFLIGLITTLVNVLSTPISFWMIERFGRRTILLWGALGMLSCQFIVAIIGTINPTGVNVKVMIAFICLSIAFFASTWGPSAWVLIGEVFPLPIRSRGVALSTASNWLWNTIIAVITPYMVGKGKGQGDLGPKVFFIWGGLCTCALVYTYFLVPETKGLSLEQVDRMLEETTARTSAKWKPSTTYAAEANMARDDEKKVDEFHEGGVHRLDA